MAVLAAQILRTRQTAREVDGGPVIDKLAAQGEATIDFPRGLSRAEDLRGEHRHDFSFSGLKTAVAHTSSMETTRPSFSAFST